MYTLNDSGGLPEVYKLNSNNGEIVQTIKIKGIQNVDWEELTRKSDTLFIGDFGNNLGTRRDLKIYAIHLPKDNQNSEVEIDTLASIRFSFEDQTDFEYKGYSITNFDCEAFVYYKNQFHIFTKRWGDSQTTHYVLDANFNNNNQIARKVESFNTGCLITGADIIDNELYLVGYTQLSFVYLWKFNDFSEGKFFNGNSKKFFLGSATSIGQIEGISATKDKIFIAGEEMKVFIFKALPTLYIINKERFN